MSTDTITPDLWLSLSGEQSENCPQPQLAPEWSSLLWLLSEDHPNSLPLSVPIKSLFFNLLNQTTKPIKINKTNKLRKKPKQTKKPNKQNRNSQTKTPTPK